MTMSQLPFLIKCPLPESRHENPSFRSIAHSQRQPTFFTPTGSRFELKTPYASLTLPYQSRDIVTKCHNCTCCNQESGRWSMVLQKNQIEKTNEFSPKVSYLDQEQFSRHRIFHETRTTEENQRETMVEPTTTTTTTTTTTAAAGKRTRTAFTPIQLLVLETAFEKNHYVVGMERKQLAIYLNLTEQQVKVWYQNRRTKYKKNIQQKF